MMERISANIFYFFMRIVYCMYVLYIVVNCLNILYILYVATIEDHTYYCH